MTYFCSKCNRLHVKKDTKIYKQHLEFDSNYSKTQINNIRFKQNWRREVEKYKKTKIALNTPKRRKN